MIRLVTLFVFSSIVDRVQTIQIGLIQNVSVTILNTSPVLFYGSCNECICAMLNSSQTISSLNCYRTNGTCHLFSNNSRSSNSELNDEFNTTFYFLQLPPNNIKNLFWPFDGSIDEAFGLVDTTRSGNISFISPGIYGRGSAIFFNDSQYLFASSTDHDLTSNGFTFEMWIYVNWLTLSSSTHQGLVGQCLSFSTSDCLHLTIRDTRLHLGFYSNDCTGNSNLSINTWYHIAFVYNVTGLRQSVFINGQLDNNCGTSGLNRMVNIPLTIGNALDRGVNRAYHGYIDQLSYTNRPKSVDEILNSATLLFYFTFNNASSQDSSSNVMIGTPYNVTFIDNTLQFNQTFSLFQVESFILPNTSSSISLWINPFSTNGSTLVHISSNSSCWNMIGFDDQGQLILQTQYNQTLFGPILSPNVWTHILQTYSTDNDLKLYINGTFFNRTGSLSYQTLSQTYTITLGNCMQSCQTCDNETTSYRGLVDEFRMYTRELNSTDIQLILNR